MWKIQRSFILRQAHDFLFDSFLDRKLKLHEVKARLESGARSWILLGVSERVLASKSKTVNADQTRTVPGRFRQIDPQRLIRGISLQSTTINKIPNTPSTKVNEPAAANWEQCTVSRPTVR